MLSTKIVASLVAAIAIASCSDDSTTNPGGNNSPIPGLAIDASVTEIAGGGSVGPGMILALAVTLENTTNAPIEVNVPAACPVRARLYRVGTDDLVYDQTVFPCDFDTTIPVTVLPDQIRTLSSGTTFPSAIEADSIPAAIYRATAVLRITGEAPVELEAGTYRLPHCPTPASCVFVGPGAIADTSLAAQRMHRIDAARPAGGNVTREYPHQDHHR